MLFVFPIVFHIIAIFSTVPQGAEAICDETAHLEKDGKILPDNSAVGASEEISCVVPQCNYSLYKVEWLQINGKTLVPAKTPGSFVPLHTVDHIIFVNSFHDSVKGIYTCKISNITTNLALYTLHFGFFSSTQTPSIESFSYDTIQYYPLLKATITVTTLSYPPTNVYWFKDGVSITDETLYNCGFDYYKVLEDGKTAEYDLFLTISEQSECGISTYAGKYDVIVNTNGMDNITESLNISQLSSPSNLSLVSISHSSIIISWSAPSSIITEYCAILLSDTNCINTNSNSTYQISVPVDETISMNRTQSEDDFFTIHLVSVGSASLANTIPSHPESINVSLEFPVISDMQFELLNASSILIKWNRESFNKHSHFIPVNTASINITSTNCSLLDRWIEVEITGILDTHSSHVVDGLHPSIQYCVSVTLSNPWTHRNTTTVPVMSSTSCFVTPSTATSAPSSSPTAINITITKQYCSPVLVSWFPIQCVSWNGILSHYELCFSEVSSNGSCDVIHYEYGNDQYSQIKGLKYYTQYWVRMARVNIGNFTGPFTNSSTFNTTECYSEPPRDFTATFVTLTTVALKWSPPVTTNGPLLHYILSYNNLPRPASSNWSIISQFTNYTITDLYPGTQYTIALAAVNSVGDSTEALTIITTDPIDAVMNLSYVSLQHSICVQWFKVPSHEIDSYRLFYSIGEPPFASVHTRTHQTPSTDLNDQLTDYTLKGVPNNTEFSISVAAVVVVNNTVEILGPWTNTSGCHHCPQRSTPITNIAIYAGAGGVGAVFIMLLLTLICCICIRCQTGKSRNDHILMMEMYHGGKAPSLHCELEDQYTTEGSDLVLEAPITGHPFPMVTWFFNDDIIADDEHFEFDEDNDCRLLLRNIALSHAGVYRFTATNTLGTVEGQIRIFVEPIKQPITEDTDTGCNGTTASCNGGHTETPAAVPLSDTVQTAPVSLHKLAGYIEKMNRKHKREFKREFGNLQSFDDMMACTVGMQAENKRRNRFEAIVPYDDNRVVLELIEGRGDCNHSYINASYIDGYSRPKQFIATQGPLPQTLVDFWRLIWQENVRCIVTMLKGLMGEGGLILCQQYWPDKGTAFYGPYKVTMESKTQYSTHIQRTLTIAPVDSSKGIPPRVVHHIQFTDWPDHGIPSSVSPLVSFVNDLEEWLVDDHAPIVVHCSAGIGRTGVLMSVIMGMEMGRLDQSVDILGTVNRLRKQRMKIIQTEEQYAFVHYAVLEGLYCKGSSIDPINIRPCMKKMDQPRDGLAMNSYEAHFEVVKVLSPNPDDVSRNKAIENPRLSRSKLFLPPDDHRVVLNKKDNDFIHASFLDGYKQDKGFIIAESPTVNTAGSFWQMIVEQKCAVIVMLCDCTEMEKDTCYPYWPAAINSVKHIGEYRVKTLEEHIDTNYIEHHILVTNHINQQTQSTESAEMKEESHEVIQLQIFQWSPSGESSHYHSIIATIGRVEVIQRQSGNKPILIHCSDTVTRSGVFCTLYKSIQQCKSEQVIDVYQVLKSLRVQKPALIPNMYLYKMVYELLARYLESEFEIYKNFSKSNEYLASLVDV